MSYFIAVNIVIQLICVVWIVYNRIRMRDIRRRIRERQAKILEKMKDAEIVIIVEFFDGNFAENKENP